jgi:hypothetical protein
MGFPRTQNARDKLYNLIDNHFGDSIEYKDIILQELIGFLDCDTIKKFIDHLKQVDYVYTPDYEDSDSDAEKDDSIDTESYEVA